MAVGATGTWLAGGPAGRVTTGDGGGVVVAVTAGGGTVVLVVVVVSSGDRSMRGCGRPADGADREGGRS